MVRPFTRVFSGTIFWFVFIKRRKKAISNEKPIKKKGRGNMEKVYESGTVGMLHFVAYLLVVWLADMEVPGSFV